MGDIRLKFKDSMTCSAMQHDLVALASSHHVFVYNIHDISQDNEIARMVFDAIVWSVAFSPCGTHVVAGLGSGLIEMRSLLDAEFNRVFQGHAHFVRRVLFSLCGSFLISGSWDRTVKIWDAAAGVCQATTNCGGLVCGLTFLPGGRKVLAGTYYGGMLVVIGMDGVKKKEVQIEGGARVTSLACAGDAVVVGLSDGRLQLREAPRLDHVVWSTNVHNYWINHVCVSPSGAEIATASYDNTSAFVSSATGEILRVLRGHKNSVATALLTPDGSKVITGSYDNTVRVCHLHPEAQTKVASFAVAFHSMKHLSFSEEILYQFAQDLKRILFK